jgi:hypothetical protein
VRRGGRSGSGWLGAWPSPGGAQRRPEEAAQFLVRLGHGLAHLPVEPQARRNSWRSQPRASSSWATFRRRPKDTPAGRIRMTLQDTSRLPNGDPAKMVNIMIDSVDQDPAPKRIALGSDACTIIRKPLTERLTALEARADLACSTDLPRNA